jgi:sugar transferase (PEP-CTERM/EpsH1 system associated)
MQFPHCPATGGETRQFHLLKAAAREHELTLVTLASPPHESASKELQSLVKKLVVLPMRGKWLQRFDSARTWCWNFHGFRTMPTYVQRLAVFRAVSDYLAGLDGSQFDLVQIEHSEIAHWVFGLFQDTPKMLVLHNVNFLIYRRMFETAPEGSPEKMRARSEWEKMRIYETGLADKFTKFVAMSAEDREHFRKIAPQADVSVVPNGVDTAYFSAAKNGTTEENALVFTGYMGWQPPEDAVVFFCRNIFPELLATYPDLKFYIVGKNPSPVVSSFDNRSNIFVTGFVEDVRPYLEKAKVVVVPLRIGGGTRLKILEAMSMGKAVVSTSVGAEGLKVTPDHDICIADSPADFILAIKKFMDSASLRASMGARARENVVQNYDWHAIGESMLHVYGEVERLHQAAKIPAVNLNMI